MREAPSGGLRMDNVGNLAGLLRRSDLIAVIRLEELFLGLIC